MKMYRLIRFIDQKVFIMLHSNDRLAQVKISEFIKQSEIKSFWQVQTFATKES